MKRSELLFTALLVPVDVAATLIAFTLAYFTRIQGEVIYIWSFSDYLRFILTIMPFWIVIFALQDLYKIDYLKRSAADELAGIFLAVSSGIMLVVAYIFLSRTEFFSRLIILYAWGYSIGLIFLGRIIVSIIRRILLKYGIGVHRIIVVGSGVLAKDVTSGVNSNPSLGYKIVKIIDRAGLDKIDKIMERTPFDELIIADQNISEGDVVELVDMLQVKGIDIKLVPNLFRTKAARFALDEIAGIPFVQFLRTPLDGWGAIIKRIMDTILSLLGLVVLSPLLVLIALIIKITSPGGPVFFRQKRVGLKKNFIFYKFRSMVPGAERQHRKFIALHGNMFKLSDDPRVTKFGKFLRRTSLDELPQLWNVLRGEMSIVGPRPPMPEEVSGYSKLQMRRLGIKPGITGLWQVSGRSDLDFSEWVRLDVFYIENWSLWLDVKIILKTFWAVVNKKGAY